MVKILSCTVIGSTRINNHQGKIEEEQRQGNPFKMPEMPPPVVPIGAASERIRYGLARGNAGTAPPAVDAPSEEEHNPKIEKKCE